MNQKSCFLNLGKIHSLSDERLLDQTFQAAKKEQAATLEFLEYLVEVDQRKLYSKLEFSSLFDYLVKKLGYSEMQASERVNVARLMRSMPEVKSKIQSGALNITVASQVQRFFNQEKNHGDRPLTPTEKVEVIENCAGKSKREVEKELFSRQSEAVKIIKKESVREVSEIYTELKFLIDDATFKKLQETKDLLGNEPLEKIFTEALNALNEKLKKKKGMDGVTETAEKPYPKQNPNSPFPGKEKDKDKETSRQALSETPLPHQKAQSNSSLPRSRFISIYAKREVFARSQGQCEWTEKETGARCDSRFKLEIDHITPFAKNGSNEPNNLRHLCRNHNQRAAVEEGIRWIR